MIYQTFGSWLSGFRGTEGIVQWIKQNTENIL